MHTYAPCSETTEQQSQLKHLLKHAKDWLPKIKIQKKKSIIRLATDSSLVTMEVRVYGIISSMCLGGKKLSALNSVSKRFIIQVPFRLKKK